MEVSTSAQTFTPSDMSPPAARLEVAAKAAQAAMAQLEGNPGGIAVPDRVALASTIATALQAVAASKGGLVALLTDLVQVQAAQGVPPAVKAAIAAVLDVSAPLQPLPSDTRIAEAFIQPATNGTRADQPIAGSPVTKAPPSLISSGMPQIGDVKAVLVALQEALKAWPSAAQPSANTTQQVIPTEAAQASTAPLTPEATPAAATTGILPSVVPPQFAGKTPGTLVMPSGGSPLDIDAALVLSILPQQTIATPAGNQPPKVDADMADAMVSLLMLQQAVKNTTASAMKGKPASIRNAGEPQAKEGVLPANVSASLYRRPASNSPIEPTTRWPADADTAFIVRTLATRTENALTQVKLLEVAVQIHKPDDRLSNDGRDPSWTFDLPVSTPQGETRARFEIHRDTYRGNNGAHATVWRARFSIDVEPLGPVHAQIALLNKNAWVSLWAEREASMQTLEAHQQLLQQTFSAERVTAEIICCLGAPGQRQKPAGSLLDNSV